MEKCPNCGAAVRPGAKFCTSCGTRLTETPAPSTPTPAQETPAATESTEAATLAAEPEQETVEGDPYATWGTPASSSPADRFEAGLDPVENASETASTTEESSTTYSASSWGQPATSDEDSDEDRFASWAAAYGSYEPPTTETPAESTEPGKRNAVDKTDEAAPEILHDVVIEQPVHDSEARKRAATLIDELRGLVWQIGVTEKTDGDENLAKVVLAGARGQSSDFSDIKHALDDVKASPRDVDVLAALSSKADRIQELLDSHNRLLGAIDEAIDELR